MKKRNGTKVGLDESVTSSPATGDSDTPEPALREYYDITSKEGRWELRCRAKGCKTGYSLTKPKPGEQVKAGNMLALLNHAYSHRLNRK